MYTTHHGNKKHGNKKSSISIYIHKDLYALYKYTLIDRDKSLFQTHRESAGALRGFGDLKKTRLVRNKSRFESAGALRGFGDQSKQDLLK